MKRTLAADTISEVGKEAKLREASLFPRDMERVDERFSKEEKQK
ncbi:MAG: hypothetical protein US77_C0013G0017 [Microgenomates group bacterium GW2011_GWC1_38_14]|nr:MAG: hypothetical protein US02_C0023G0006 [Candidatus Levybacteria bacterium GW2011_GWA2_36_13]KKP99163.1 MAG: hypothetical protein US07_C0023G0011 [Candidatus Levybacteria bacterium GW2011_GWB1_36_18]KKQ57972.1 MAG: hypothetical protein US77_C0013G0017 [Microgenomates group bacterium GW2011_GWC1_38_14]KKR14910.1 MAG: hypothetical protein UT44_C0047G0003 [Candidatus Levybacteria bacterium GW2011_GWA1_39_32]